jgi:protein-disulfide isomerase
VIGLRRVLGRLGLAAVALGLVATPLYAAASPPAAPATTPAAPAVPDEMSMGNPRARISVIEYASLGCPHCAEWSRDVFPQFKKTYIDTGKVRFVLREMLFGDSTLSAAGFLVARCAGRQKYFDLVQAIFNDQADIENGGAKALLKLAEPFGLTEDRFKACLQDDAALKILEARANRYVTDDSVTGTPTFVIGDQRLLGGQTLAQLDAAITAARAAARARSR